MSHALEMLAALLTVSVYAVGLYVLILHRSRQTARIPTEKRR